MTSQPSKVAFLTGSTSGIGRATAQELVKHLSILILPVRNITKGQDLKQELLEINPNCQIDLYKCDLESIESMKICANTIASKYEAIDIIINNAGTFDYQCHFTNDGLASNRTGKDARTGAIHQHLRSRTTWDDGSSSGVATYF